MDNMVSVERIKFRDIRELFKDFFSVSKEEKKSKAISEKVQEVKRNENSAYLANLEKDVQEFGGKRNTRKNSSIPVEQFQAKPLQINETENQQNISDEKELG